MGDEMPHVAEPPVPVEVDDEVDTTTLFVGDSGSGKSSLIQSFLKPTVTKEPKSTFALEYNFARKKGGSGSGGSERSVAHIWELGGDIYEPKLLEIPLTLKGLSNTSVVIVCDLSRPQNIMTSLLRWVGLVREVINKRVGELKATNSSAVAGFREKAMGPFREHPKDSARVRPCEVPLYIVANKFDSFRALGAAERRQALQCLRFVAHYHGATLIAASTADLTLKESFRSLCNTVCFGAPLKSACETSVDKPVYVTVGRDDFEGVLLGSAAGGAGGAGEASLSQFLTPQGVSRECWGRLSDLVKGVFGPADVGPEGVEGVEEGRDENEFPEAEVDSMRAQRDTLLVRYLQEAERKELMLSKMNSSTADAKEGRGGGDPDAKPSKKKSSSRK